jgi:hypothetical protein
MTFLVIKHIGSEKTMSHEKGIETKINNKLQLVTVREF